MDLVTYRRLSDGRYLDEFETSVPMSTYLVAFIVSDFTYVEKGNQRVYAQPDYISYGDGDFALDVGGPVIAALESYTYVPYALKKMYQVRYGNGSSRCLHDNLSCCFCGDRRATTMSSSPKNSGIFSTSILTFVSSLLLLRQKVFDSLCTHSFIYSQNDISFQGIFGFRLIFNLCPPKE